jgi:dienelactone hydrolase
MKAMQFKSVALIVSFSMLLLGVHAAAEDSGRVNIEERYIKNVPSFQETDDAKSEGVKAIYYDGPEYRGKPTKIFAYYGIPKSKDGAKVPAIVLVHGGSGTAFPEWVRLWNGRGYAAIAMDTCGSIPVKDEKGGWKRIPDGGPAGCGDCFQQTNLPFNEQWPNYVQNAIACARSLIGGFPEVDNEKVGIAGVSWGGYAVCIAAALDRRYKFAASSYGCGGFLRDNFPQWRLVWGNKPDIKAEMERWNASFDPLVYLPEVRIPILFVTGPSDRWFPLESLKRSQDALANAPVTLCAKPGMPHGHVAGQTPQEIKIFADSILSGGAPLPAMAGEFAIRDGLVMLHCKPIGKIAAAELLHSKDGIQTESMKRIWESSPAQIDASGCLSAKTPPQARIAFFNVRDERGNIVSSPLLELPER